MRTCFVVPLLLLAGTGCHKHDGPTLVEGQVVERVSGQPVGNAWVQVHAMPNDGALGGYQPVGQPQQADAQGRFSFSVEPPGGQLIVMANTPLGYHSNYGEVPTVKAGRRNKDLRVPMQAPAWLRFRLTDEPPRSRVWMFIGGFASYTIRLSLPHDTSFVAPLNAQTPWRVTWGITNEQGQELRYYRDVNVPALDTLPVDIRF